MGERPSVRAARRSGRCSMAWARPFEPGMAGRGGCRDRHYRLGSRWELSRLPAQAVRIAPPPALSRTALSRPIGPALAIVPIGPAYEWTASRSRSL